MSCPSSSIGKSLEKSSVGVEESKTVALSEGSDSEEEEIVVVRRKKRT